MPGNESLHLQVLDGTIRVPELPSALDGLRILHISDLHFSPAFDRRFFEAVADEAAGEEVDLVLFTGDLIDDEQTLAWVEPVLSRLRGRLGTFAILGNHDHRYAPEGAAEALRGAGFTVLEGTWARLEVNGKVLAIGGTSAPWGPELDPAAMPDADARLVLTHTPDQFYEIASWGVDLLFAGHNHGGQYRLPIFGPVLMPSRFSRRFDRGFFRYGQALMHVSQGVAGKHPLRVNCLPEVARFTLQTSRPLPDDPSDRSAVLPASTRS